MKGIKKSIVPIVLILFIFILFYQVYKVYKEYKEYKESYKQHNSKKAICLLCASYCPEFLDYANSVYSHYTDYDVYVCIDKTQTVSSDYKKYNHLNFLLIDSQPCEEKGFKGSVLYFLDRACSRDKALYYFSMVNQTYDFVWFVEDDVYFKDPNNIRYLDQRHSSDTDLLVREHRIKYSKEVLDWHWKHVNGKIDLPWASSMICIVRLSKKMLEAIADYATKNGHLFLDEALFNTLCVHYQLKVESPPEFEHITYVPELLPAMNDRRDDYFYHPMKEFWKNL